MPTGRPAAVNPAGTEMAARPVTAGLVSANIINALQTAREMKATSIGLLGHDGGQCKPLCDHALIVSAGPAKDSAFTQEAHQVIMHLFCEAVENST